MKERLQKLTNRFFNRPFTRFKETVAGESKPQFLHYKLSRYVFFTPEYMWARKTADLWGDTQFDTLVKQDTENKTRLKNIATKVSMVGVSLSVALFIYGGANRNLVEAAAGSTSAVLFGTYGITTRKRIDADIQANKEALDVMGNTYILAKTKNVFVPMTVTVQSTMKRLANLPAEQRVNDVRIDVHPWLPGEEPKVHEMLLEEKTTRFGWRKESKLIANQAKLAPENTDLSFFQPSFD